MPPPVTPTQTVPVYPGAPATQYTTPAANLPPTLPPATAYGQPPPPINGSVPQSSMWWGQPIEPAPLYPEGFNWETNSVTRLFQDTGALYTYIYGSSGNELQIHELELFSSAVIKQFLQTPSDLRITPGFIFDFLDGPAGAAAIDLPSTLYSGYLNFLWQPQLTPQFNADINFRVGVYTDSDSTNSDSVRFTGRGLGVFQMTPTSAFKLGIEYLDRNEIKILPAGGLVWTPDDQTIIDLYFPKPMYSRYWQTNGNTELWWHFGAEYGGGSWTIKESGGNERIDINDIRVFAGLDWNRLDRMDGILEIGYVFEREVVAVNDPSKSTDISDSFMIRTGFKY